MMARFIQYVLMLKLYQISFYQCCSPGGGRRRPNKKIVNAKIPNLSESLEQVSGPFIAHILKNDSSLEHIISTDIFFKDSDFDSEARLSIKVIFFYNTKSNSRQLRGCLHVTIVIYDIGAFKHNNRKTCMSLKRG